MNAAAEEPVIKVKGARGRRTRRQRPLTAFSGDPTPDQAEGSGGGVLGDFGTGLSNILGGWGPSEAPEVLSPAQTRAAMMPRREREYVKRRERARAMGVSFPMLGPPTFREEAEAVGGVTTRVTRTGRRSREQSQFRAQQEVFRKRRAQMQGRVSPESRTLENPMLRRNFMHYMKTQIDNPSGYPWEDDVDLGMGPAEAEETLRKEAPWLFPAEEMSQREVNRLTKLHEEEARDIEAQTEAYMAEEGGDDEDDDAIL